MLFLRHQFKMMKNKEDPASLFDIVFYLVNALVPKVGDGPPREYGAVGI